MRTLRFAIIFGMLFFPVAVAINSFRFGYNFKEAYWRTLMTPFEGTVWAPGFKESAFSKLRIGMAAAEVLELLGAPIRKSCDEAGCLWIYTWQDTGTADFDQRWVDFDPSDRVKEIRKSFFID
jgi:hypothetical protein